MVYYTGVTKTGKQITTSDKSQIDTSHGYVTRVAPPPGKIEKPVVQTGGYVPSTPSASNVKSIAPTGGGTLTIIDKATGEVIRQGTPSTGTGLPSIAPPTSDQASVFYASQKQDISQRINESILTKQLSQPTQSISSGFGQVGGVSSGYLDTARQALAKPMGQRTVQEQAAVIQAANESQAYQREVQKQQQGQNIVRQGFAPSKGGLDFGKQEPEWVTAAKLESRPTVLQKPLDKGFIQGQQIAEAVVSIPGQVVEGAYESLIVVPGELGKRAGLRSKNILELPANIGKELGKSAIGAVTLVVTQPDKVVLGTFESFFKSPAKFVTQLGVNALAFKGVGSIASKVVGKVTTVGKTYIPEAKLVVPEVTSGLKNFPTTKSPISALKEFNKTTYAKATGKQAVYSASDYPFTPFTGRNITVTSGRGLVKGVDVPGLYTSTKGVSTYFLRLKQGLGEYKLFPSSLKELLPGQPKILAVAGTPTRIPGAFRTSLAKAQSYFGKKGLTLTEPKGVPGKPYISPALEFGLKTEAEAVIQVGSKLKRVGLVTPYEKLTGFSKYTKINGRVVPIYEMKVVGKSAVRGLTQKVSAASYSSSSSGIVSKSIVSPSSVAAGYLVPSKKVSVPSYVVPKVSSLSVSTVKYSPSNVVSSVKSVSSYITPKVSEPVVSKTSSVSRSSSGSSVSSVVSVPSYVPSTVSSVVSKGKSYKSIVSKVSSKKIGSYRVPTYSYKVPPPVYKLNKVSQTESKKKRKSLRLSGAFSVVSRVKGKQVTLALGVPKNIAVAIGKRFTGETTARSFKIKQVGFTSKQDIGRVDLTQYRQPKFSGKVAREGFTFVEKSKFAIDTPGEVKGLKLGKFKAKLSM